jgi:hypothetical protein
MTEAEDQKSKIAELERRCADLDKRVMGFEAWANMGKWIGVTLVAVASFLVSQTLSFENTLHRANGVEATLVDLETRTKNLKANVDDLGSRRAEARLLARIAQLQAPDPKASDLCDKDPWSDAVKAYRHDLETLANLGLEYVS